MTRVPYGVSGRVCGIILLGENRMMLFACTSTTNLALTCLRSNPGVGSERQSSIHPTEPRHGGDISIFSSLFIVIPQGEEDEFINIIIIIIIIMPVPVAARSKA